MVYDKQTLEQFVKVLYQAFHDYSPQTYLLKPPYSPSKTIGLLGGTVEYVDTWNKQGVFPVGLATDRTFKVCVYDRGNPHQTNDYLAEVLGLVLLYLGWDTPSKWKYFCEESKDRGIANFEELLRQYFHPNGLYVSLQRFASSFLTPQDVFLQTTSTFFSDSTASGGNNQFTKACDYLSNAFEITPYRAGVRLKELHVFDINAF